MFSVRLSRRSFVVALLFICAYMLIWRKRAALFAEMTRSFRCGLSFTWWDSRILFKSNTSKALSFPPFYGVCVCIILSNARPIWRVITFCVTNFNLHRDKLARWKSKKQTNTSNTWLIGLFCGKMLITSVFIIIVTPSSYDTSFWDASLHLPRYVILFI